MLRHPEECKRVYSTVLLDPVIFLLCDPTVATTFVYKDPQSCVDLVMHYFLSRELFIANALSRHFQWSHNILFVEDLLSRDGDQNNHNNMIGNNGSGLMRKQLLGSSSSNSSGKGGGSGRNSQRSEGSDDFYVADVEQEVMSSSYSGSSSPGIRTRSAARRQITSNNGINNNNNNGKNILSSRSSSEYDQIRHSIFLSSHDAIVPVGPVSRYLEGKRAEGCSIYEVTLFHGTHGEIFVYPKWVRMVTNKIKERCDLTV